MPKTDLRLTRGAPGDYALVADRIARFYARHPEGRIITRLVAREERRGTREVTFRAALYRDRDERRPAATGWASERENDGEVNAVACLENAETSAVGRALTNLGFAATRPRREGTDAGDGGQPAPAAPAASAPRPRIAAPHSHAERRPPTRSAPSSPAARGGEDRQASADAVTDVLRLLDTARRAGLAPRRAERLRTRLLALEDPSPAVILRLERAIRGWLVHARMASSAVFSRQRKP